jgi:hypothetical protein
VREEKMTGSSLVIADAIEKDFCAISAIYGHHVA